MFSLTLSHYKHSPRLNPISSPTLHSFECISHPITNRSWKNLHIRTLQSPIHRNLHRKLPLKQTLPTLLKLHFRFALPAGIARLTIFTMVRHSCGISRPILFFDDFQDFPFRNHLFWQHYPEGSLPHPELSIILPFYQQFPLSCLPHTLDLTY